MTSFDFLPCQCPSEHPSPISSGKFQAGSLIGGSSLGKMPFDEEAPVLPQVVCPTPCLHLPGRAWDREQRKYAARKCVKVPGKTTSAGARSVLSATIQQAFSLSFQSGSLTLGENMGSGI